MSETIGEIYVGVWEGDKELWRATNQPVQADFLVVVDPGLGGVDPKVADRYKEALDSLSRKATSRQDLSQYAWLFSTERSLKEIFNDLITFLGIEHHNYSVLQLNTGKGLAYNAKRRVVYEISSG